MNPANASSSTARIQSALSALAARLEHLPPDRLDLLAAGLDRLAAGLDEPTQQTRPGEPSTSAEQLLESEVRAAIARAKYKTLFDAFPLGITITDSAGQILESNPEAERLLGLSKADHTRRKIDSPEWQIIYPDGSPMAPEEYPSTRALKNKQRVENVEMGILKPGGEITWINVCATPIPLEGYGVVITYGDTTARKQTEEHLHVALSEAAHEKNRLQAVMEALPVGVAIIDPQGGSIQSNQAFEQIWGGPRPPTTSIADYHAYKAWWVDSGLPVQPEKWASARAVQNGETVIDQFMQIERFDGSGIYVLNSAAPIFDALGRIAGSAVAIQDITARVQAEQALLLANSRFNTLLDNLPVGVVLTDAAGNFLISNPANQALFGESGITGDATGPSSGYTLRYPDGSLIPSEALPLMRALKEGVSMRDFEFIIRRESGEDISILANCSPVCAPGGGILGAVAAMQDVTRLKLVETQQRLLEFREKERQEVARDLHDGPIQDLSGILFNIQFAKEAIPDRAAVLEFEQVGLSVQNVIRGLREVCNNLRPPSLIRFGLARAIRVHAEDLRDRQPELDLRLNLSDDAGQLPEQTNLALYRIYQEAINNILRHARATQVRVLLSQENGQTLLQILDNGAGFLVPPDLAIHTRSGHFGLAGMKERADIIDADLQVTSAPGCGTTVCVTVGK